MRKYKFKRGFKPDVGRLEEMMEKHFDDFKKDGDKYTATFGATKATLWFEGKLLAIETETDPTTPYDIAAQAVKIYNRFLEDLTGYTAKDRRKMMKKEVEK